MDQLGSGSYRVLSAMPLVHLQKDEVDDLVGQLVDSFREGVLQFIGELDMKLQSEFQSLEQKETQLRVERQALDAMRKSLQEDTAETCKSKSGRPKGPQKVRFFELDPEKDPEVGDFLVKASEVETSSASPTGEAREFCESQFAETLDVLEVGGRSMSCHVTLRSTHVLEQEEVEALHNVWGEATFQRQGALAAAKSLLLHSRSPLADRWATHLHSGAKAVGSGVIRWPRLCRSAAQATR
ncbi:unnamed protein product [Effrenium voratum]|nr:unnamed protein product [Effrenium voratum]CAJ1454246.1 unnamed protein product [Effrenium voratum]